MTTEEKNTNICILNDLTDIGPRTPTQHRHLQKATFSERIHNPRMSCTTHILIHA